MRKSDRVEILISGIGGQGILMLGTVLGSAVVTCEGKYATQAPSYGTETRGSAADSQVVISSDKIGFPEVEEPDVFVAMTQAALGRHWRKLRRNTKIIVDADLVSDVPEKFEKVWRIAAARLSEENLASRHYANMVMFGAFVQLTGLVGLEAARRTIRELVPHDTIDRNLKAFELGIKALKDR